MLELLAIAELVLVPVAVKVRDQLVDRLATAVTDASADRLTSWFRAVAEERTSRDELGRELASDPELAVQVRHALRALPGGDAVPSEDTLPDTENISATSASEQQLDAYAEVLYQLAVSATWTQHPVVIEGFLQGPEWLTVCDPGDWRGAVDRTPAPHDLWIPTDRDGPVLERSGLLTAWQLSATGPGRSLTYRIRYAPDAGQRAAGRASLERQFRLDSGAPLPDDDDDLAVNSRWHNVLRIRPYWVQLTPFGPEFHKTDILLNRIQTFGQYPEEWHPLMEIHDPPEGIASVRRSTLGVLRLDEEFQSRIEEALSVT